MSFQTEQLFSNELKQNMAILKKKYKLAYFFVCYKAALEHKWWEKKSMINTKL